MENLSILIFSYLFIRVFSLYVNQFSSTEKIVYIQRVFLNDTYNQFPWRLKPKVDFFDYHFMLSKLDCEYKQENNFGIHVHNFLSDQKIMFDLVEKTYGSDGHRKFTKIHEEILYPNEEKSFTVWGCGRTLFPRIFLKEHIPQYENQVEKPRLKYALVEFVATKFYDNISGNFFPNIGPLTYVLIIGIVIITVALILATAAIAYFSIKNKLVYWQQEKLRALQRGKDRFFLNEKDVVEYGEIVSYGSYGFIRKGVMLKKTDIGVIKIPVAIKAIRITVESGNTSQHIDREIKAMKELNNENIIQYYGCKFEKDKAWIVMQFCEKGDLHGVLRSCRVSRRAKLKILLKIARGMAYLHSKEFVHRDLKTQNILLTADNKIKICDFGTTKNVGSVNQTLCGTVEYLAPEQFDIDLIKDSDPRRIDIYSYGIIIWEVWSCKTPFQSLRKKCVGNEIEMMSQIHSRRVRPDEVHMKDSPKSLVTLMKRCWSHFPFHRPSNFEEIVNIMVDIFENYDESGSETETENENEIGTGKDSDSESDSDESSSSLSGINGDSAAFYYTSDEPNFPKKKKSYYGEDKQIQIEMVEVSDTEDSDTEEESDEEDVESTTETEKEDSEVDIFSSGKKRRKKKKVFIETINVPLTPSDDIETETESETTKSEKSESEKSESEKSESEKSEFQSDTSETDE